MTTNELKDFLKSVYKKPYEKFDCNGFKVFYNPAENFFRYTAILEDPAGSTVKNGIKYRTDDIPFATAYKSPFSGDVTIVLFDRCKRVLNGKKDPADEEET